MTLCLRPIRLDERIGAPCPECGHTNIVHPGRQNPSLSSCVICALARVAIVLLGTGLALFAAGFVVLLVVLILRRVIGGAA